MRYKYVFIAMVMLQALFLTALSQPPQLNAIRIERDIAIDGILNEPEWKDAGTATNFHLNFPSDTATVSSETIVQLLYNENYLYVAATLMNQGAFRHPYIISSLKRDFLFPENDAFGIIIDPFNDHTNGYGFYVNAYGAQREEQLYNGLLFDPTWDIKWFSAVAHNDSAWIAELAIPLRYLRFNRNSTAWNINFIRNDVGNNQRSSWATTPRNFILPNLSYAGLLLFPQPPRTPGNKVSLTPSLTLNAGQLQKGKIDIKLRPSLDAKLAVTPSLNLDLTLNPDFSQAEVDQAQVNLLSYYELSYPEKRLFFIENSDLFSQFGVEKDGASPVHPFYSRRIGLKYNNNTGQYEQTSILAGLRLSGKINNDLRIGLMSVQTAASGNTDANGNTTNYPQQNYSVIALQQKVFSGSNIGIIVTNRQAFGDDSTGKFHFNKRDYNRLAGIDYNLISKDGKWTGKLYEHIMFNDSVTSSSQGGWLNYNARKITGWLGFTRAGKDFSSDAGFVPRNNFINFYGELDYLFYPKSGIINNWYPVMHYKVFLDEKGRNTDYFYKAGFLANFKNTALSYLLYLGFYTKLPEPFNPSLDNGKALPAGSEYYYKEVAFYYLSDLRRKYAGELYVQAGKYFNGSLAQLNGYVTRKVQPYGSFGVAYSLSFIHLPKPYSSNNVYAAGPRADISFSKKLFFNTNIQYTNLNSNINFFFRLQYRFKPLSDIFLVYSNNEDSQLWQRKDHSLILKMVYFL